MKTKLLLALLAALGYSVLGHAQSEEAFQTFEYQDGDTTYVMQKYFFCMLKRGANADEIPQEELAKLQQAHLAHISSMADAGKVCMAGPFDGNGDNRGILVFRTATLEEAESLVSEDPAVKAGRLSYEITPWWAARGSKLY